MLGLHLTEEDSFAIVLDANGTMLRLSKVPEFTPADHGVVGWQVEDIAAMVRQLSERGVTFTRYPGMDQDELGVWSHDGVAKVAWFKDPDGNTLSLTEFATD